MRISEGGVGERGWWTGIGGTNRFCVLRSLAFSLTGAELYFCATCKRLPYKWFQPQPPSQSISFPEIMVKKTAKENATPVLPISSFSLS